MIPVSSIIKVYRLLLPRSGDSRPGFVLSGLACVWGVWQGLMGMSLLVT